MYESQHPLKRKRLALLCAAILLFVAGLWFGTHKSCLSVEKAVAKTADPVPGFTRQGDEIIIPQGSAYRSRLKIAPVALENIPRVLQLPAVVEAEPERTVNILPPVSGKVVALDVQLGQVVKKGQPLVVIDSGDLAQAYADDEKARAALKQAKFALDRAQGVYKVGGGPKKDVEGAQNDYLQAQAEFNRAESRLKEIGVCPGARCKTRLLTMTSPITGIVTALTTASGDFANDVTATLMTISNLDEVWVTAMAPENDIAYVSRGQAVGVSFDAYPGRIFHGRVSFVSAVLDPATRRTSVRICFANPKGELKPNMFATVSIRIPQSCAVYAPDSALLMNNDSTTVLVETKPWVFVRRTVTPGYDEGNQTRIDHGLRPGDRIVVKGGVLLND
ncbi:MAG: efflux RND transporter periplasmic adaptor subunit [Syntrophobacteraceae bacterium]